MELMKKFLKYIFILFCLIWTCLALMELSTKPEGQSPSILSQMWVSYGVPYAIFFGILRWFLYASGLSKLGSHIERSRKHMEFVEQEIIKKQSS